MTHESSSSVMVFAYSDDSCWPLRIGPGDPPELRLPAPRGHYDISVVSMDGSRCEQRGSLAGGTGAHVASDVDPGVRQLRLVLHNLGERPLTYRLACGEFSFESTTTSVSVGPGMSRPLTWGLSHSYGWYDVVVTVDEDPSYRRRLTGHVRRP
jgi:phospholipase C